MKFRVTMKDPDALSDAVDEAVKTLVAEKGLTDDRAVDVYTEVHKSGLIGRLCEKTLRRRKMREWIERDLSADFPVTYLVADVLAVFAVAFLSRFL